MLCHRRNLLRRARLATPFRPSQNSCAILFAHLFPVTHTKLPASFVSPLPLYFAICGYGQSGRVIFTPFAGSPLSYFVATIAFGAIPFSTHCSSASSTLRCASFAPAPPCPKESGPGPPPQCCIPGTM